MERRGQEQRAGELGDDLADQLFLIFAIEGAAAVGRRQRRDGRRGIVECRDRADDVRAVADIADNGTAGALMHGRVQHARLVLQIRLEQISLLECHAVLLHTHAKPAAAFVFNICFHMRLPPTYCHEIGKEGHSPSLFALERLMPRPESQSGPRR